MNYSVRNGFIRDLLAVLETTFGYNWIRKQGCLKKSLNNFDFRRLCHIV
jgi:hypothetical protein